MSVFVLNFILVNTYSYRLSSYNEYKLSDMSDTSNISSNLDYNKIYNCVKYNLTNKDTECMECNNFTILSNNLCYPKNCLLFENNNISKCVKCDNNYELNTENSICEINNCESYKFTLNESLCDNCDDNYIKKNNTYCKKDYNMDLGTLIVVILIFSFIGLLILCIIIITICGFCSNKKK